MFAIIEVGRSQVTFELVIAYEPVELVDRMEANRFLNLLT